MKKIVLIVLVGIVSCFGAYNTTGTDYDKALVRTYTEEDTLRALDTVNMILRFMKDSRADKFINKGPYKVMQKDDEKQGGAQTGTGSTKTESLVPMTFNVTRDTSDETAPMIVKLWLDEDDGPGEKPQRIIGYMKVEKGVDSEYPMGKFTFHFAGFGIQSNGETNSSDNIMNGVLGADKGSSEGLALIQYENTMSEQGMDFIEAIKMEIDGDNKGKGFTNVIVWGENQPVQKKYKLTLDSRYYKVQELNSTTHENVGSEIIKDKQSKIIKTFRYGLYYDTNGSKVEMNSGFPIKDATGNYGYAGYWGIWSQDDIMSDGTTVTKEGTSDSYTVVAAPGKLKKYTRSSASMESIKNTKLYFWNQNDGQQYILSWDATLEDYKILGIQNQYGEADASALVGITANEYLFTNDYNGSGAGKLQINEWSNAWSEALQASIKVDSTITNTSSISFHKEEVVIPDTNLTLVNFGWEVINPDMNISDLNNTASIRFEDNNSIIGGAYQYNVDNLVLIDLNRSQQAVVFADGANFNNTTYERWQYGTQMGPLITADRASSYNASNWWNVEQNEDVYYKWETGSQNWNKFTGLKDSNGDILTFDPPKTFAYTHDSTKDANGDEDNGGLYSLQYDGYDLQIPWTFDEATNNWFPKINIKSATTLSDGSITYRIKALESGILIGETETEPSVTWISNDLNTSYDGVEHNLSLITNETGVIVPDANVTVIKGKCLYEDCAMTQITP